VEALSFYCLFLEAYFCSVFLVKKYSSICIKMPRKKQHLVPENVSVLQRLREEAGLTQEQLAKQIPDKSGVRTISQRSISYWETGQSQPELTIPQIKALCRALGKSLDELPDDIGPPK
jgi:DNA-binding XRE family transcriptional regulator